MSDELIVRTENRVRYLLLNRPRTRNGLTPDLVEQLRHAVLGLESAGDVRAAVIGGEGGAFCSGLDLRQGPPQGGADKIEGIMRESFHGLIRAIDSCPKPTVAFVDGAAAGFGVGLALACDLRIGTERAMFALTFARIGLMPDGGTTWSLPRAVGLGKALDLMMLADKIGAEEALRIGLLERLVPSAESQQAITGIAERLAKGPPIAYRALKKLTRQHLTSSLADALESEVPSQMKCIESKDFGRGLMSFMTKQDAQFEGD